MFLVRFVKKMIFKNIFNMNRDNQWMFLEYNSKKNKNKEALEDLKNLLGQR